MRIISAIRRRLCSRPEQRVFTRADGYAEKDLLNFAYDHLASAKVLFKTSPSCYDSAASLSHLGIELILKALLLNRTGQFPATHDLKALRRLVVRAAPEVEFTQPGLQLLARINRFFSLRYPEPSGAEPLGTEDLGPILELSKALVSGFPADLQAEFSSTPTKGGRLLMKKPAPPSGAA